MTRVPEPVPAQRTLQVHHITPLMEVREVVKRFGGLIAVASASVAVNRGEIVGVIGPNGAGKTTLFALLSGFLRVTSGEIRFEGTTITNLRPRQLCNTGIARTFQVVRPFHDMTVYESVKAAAVFGNRAKRSNTVVQQEVDEILATTGLASMADRYPPALSLPQRKRLEIARALATCPKLLLLDEVLAGLNPIEVQGAMPFIRSLNTDHGITILMIEHNLRAIMGVCGRILVLNFGRLIFDGPPEAAVRDEGVIEAYLGSRDNA